MLALDGIIYSLQAYGGVTAYFDSIHSRLRSSSVGHRLLRYNLSNASPEYSAASELKCHPRFAERYRACSIPLDSTLFHSSYYRLPDRRVPTVTTVHDFVYEYCMTGPKQWLHSRQKFDAIRLSDAIICVSHSTRNDLLRFIPDVDPDLVHVVYNGVSDSFFPLPSSSSKLSGLRSNYVLYVGSRASYKNFTIVVQSLSGLPNLSLVCVGGGSLSHRERSILDKLIPLRFKHYPFASQHQLNILYNNAYCLAYPSSYEGFGIPILEAMRAGCPVIAVNTSSIPEVSGSAALLLARPTAEELSHALLNIGNRELRNLLRSQGFAQSKLFSWDRCFVDTMRVYEAANGGPLCS